MPETTTTDTVEPSAHPAGGTKPTELVVRYRFADGILIEGKTYPHRNEVKRAQPRWRWCGSLRQWGVPRTRERMLSSDQVEECAEGLRTAGVPNVRVDYQEPRPGDVLDLDQLGDVAETLEERALDRAERLDGATAWLDRMKPITAAHFVRCLPTSYRNAMGIVGEHRARYGLERAQPRPRKADPTAARRILEEVLGIAFDAEDEDGASSDHRDGGTAPEALGELAKEHATGTTATAASAVSEAISAVMQEIEQVTSSLIGTLEHEATTGPEDEKVTDSVEDERLADEPADTREGTTDEHAAGTPSADASGGSFNGPGTSQRPVGRHGPADSRPTATSSPALPRGHGPRLTRADLLEPRRRAPTDHQTRVDPTRTVGADNQWARRTPPRGEVGELHPPLRPSILDGPQLPSSAPESYDRCPRVLQTRAWGKAADVLPLLTVQEAAAVLRSTPDAIYRRIRRGTLPAVRDGKRVLVPRRAIEAVTGPLGRQPQPDARPSNGLRGLSPEPRMETTTPECTTNQDFFSILPCTNGKARWVVNFYVHEVERKRPRNVRRRSPHESKAETRRWATQTLAGLAAKAPEPVTSTGITLRVACERWLATQATDLRNKQRFIRWILLAWGEETTMRSLTHEQIVGLGAKLRQPLGPRASERSRARRPEREGRPRHRKGEGLSPSTVRAVCQTANRILSFAAEMGWRSAAHVPLAKVAITEAEWLTVDDLRAVLDHAGKWRLAIMLGARAGLRRGEIVELRWRDVDLENQRIRVSRSFRKNDAGEWVVSTCKGKEARTVTIPPDLVSALSEAQGKRGDLVVTMDGERIPPPTFSEAVPEILQAAGLYRPGLGVHALRHTYCSHLAQGGAPGKAIQILAGHKSERTTARYLHLSPLHVVDAVRCLPSLTKL